jgi:hypothetical protein
VSFGSFCGVRIIREDQIIIQIIIMGSIGSCCPCFDDDSDVDSLEKASSATVNGELESEGIKKKMEKRLNKDAEIELRRQ